MLSLTLARAQQVQYPGASPADADSPEASATNYPAAPEFTLTNLSNAQLGPQSATGTPGTPPGAHFGGTSQLASAPRLPAGAQPAGTTPFQWGPIRMRPHLDYQLSYGNSLQPTPGHQVNSFVNAVSPGILLLLGDHWSLDYTPTLRFYSDSHFQDGTDQAVILSGGTTYEAWVLGLSQSYASTSQPLIETAAQTSQQTYSTSLNASRPLGGKLSLDLALGQDFLFLDNSVPVEGLSDSRTWSTLDWLNYQLFPHLSAGLVLGFSYDNLSAGPDITAEQYQGRLIWTAGQKLSLVLSGGLNDMQFLNSTSPDLLSPVFSLSAQYQLFRYTTLSLGASRSLSPAYFAGQVLESTGLNGGLSQRLLGKLYLSVSGGYVNSSYHSTVSGAAATSVSDYDTASLSVALSTTFLTRATASVFFAQDYITSSGSSAYNYTTTESGLELSYRY